MLKRILLVVIECCPALAVFWPASGQAMPAELLRARLNQKTVNDELFGFLNIRAFGIDSEEEILLDTLGMEPFGLPDVQCHYRGLPRAEMVDYMFDVAAYLFSNDQAIEDGNTIDGLTPNDVWLCQYEQAQIGPPRTVIDIVAGEHAAGDRG